METNSPLFAGQENILTPPNVPSVSPILSSSYKIITMYTQVNSIVGKKLLLKSEINSYSVTII